MCQVDILDIVFDFFSVQAVAVSGSRYSTSNFQGPIWLDSVHCGGTENSLANCGHDPWGVSDCDHTEDVGIICETGLYHVTTICLFSCEKPRF